MNNLKISSDIYEMNLSVKTIFGFFFNKVVLEYFAPSYLIMLIGPWRGSNKTGVKLFQKFQRNIFRLQQVQFHPSNNPGTWLHSRHVLHVLRPGHGHQVSHGKHVATGDMIAVFRWRVPRDCLARFILMVKRGYRDPPYHNWSHGFTVAHFAYLILDTGNFIRRGVIRWPVRILQNVFSVFSSDLEAFALLVACMCHDLDHRGTNNNFQVNITGPVTTLITQIEPFD